MTFQIHEFNLSDTDKGQPHETRAMKLAKNRLQYEILRYKMNEEVKKLIKDSEQFNDYPGKVHETDIYQFTNSQVISDIYAVDEDGEETAFKDVVRIFRDPQSQTYMTKYCSIKLLQYDENEEAV